MISLTVSDSMKLTTNMTFMNQIKQYIDGKQYGEPILLVDVVRDFYVESEDFKKTRNTVSAYLNRLVKNNELKKFDDGVFYKSKKNSFGDTTIDYTELIEKTYLYDSEKDSKIGYRVGATMLTNIGISNNLENVIEIVTNNFNRRKVVDTIKQNIHLKKPIMEVNNDNFMYLQLLDTIKEIDKYHLTSDRVGEKIVDYMNKK